MDSLNALFNDLESATKDPCDIICEACEEFKGTALNYARALMNAQMLSNSVMRDYNLNLKQAKLHCIQSNGTDDDYMLYEDAAEQGVIGRLRAIINRIIEWWVEFCRRTTQLIKTKVCTAQAKAAVKKMKNEVRLDSALANKRVEAPDITSALSVIAKYRKLCDVNDAKFVRGIITKSPEKGIGATIASFETAFKNATVGAAAVTLITVGALIIAIEEEMDKLPKYVMNLETTQSHILDRLAQTVSDETAAASMEALQAAANFRIQLGKQELETHMSYLAELIKMAREIINNAKGKGTTVINVVESGEETGDLADDIVQLLGGDTSDMFQEGANLDARDIFKDCQSTYKMEMKAARNSINAENWGKAKSHLANASAVLKKAERQLDVLDIDMASVILGFIGRWLITGLKELLVMIPTLGIGSWVIEIKHWIEQITTIINSVKKNGTISASDFDMYINTFKARIKEMQAKIKMMEKRVDELKRGAKKGIKKEEAIDINYDGLFSGNAPEVFEEDSDSDIDHFLDGVFDAIV